MAAGVASGLQNRFGVRIASRVGSIPTRSRHRTVVSQRPGVGLLLVGRSAGVLCFLLIAVPTGGLLSQETDPPARADSISQPRPIGDPAVTPDSLAVTDSAAVRDSTAGADSAATPGALEAAGAVPTPATATRADSAGPSPPISPTGAFFRSLILPGWGQISADQPGRGAFYFAMEAGSLWMLFKTNAKLNAAKRSNPLDEDLIASREAQFEDWAALAVFWALFSGVDAWVSAQLWDFKGEVVPPPDGSAGAAFQYSIPVGP